MYMLVIFFVYTCIDLNLLTAGVFGNYPPHPFYIGECDDNYDVTESLFGLDST